MIVTQDTDATKEFLTVKLKSISHIWGCAFYWLSLVILDNDAYFRSLYASCQVLSILKVSYSIALSQLTNTSQLLVYT